MFERHDFKTWDGTILSAGVWRRPDSSVSRPLVVVHGMGEHLLRYEKIAGELLTYGYQVYSFDLRGHGRSPGARGDAPGLHYHVQDVLAFLDWVRSRQTRATAHLPVVAHSMGGLLALQAALASPTMFQSLFLISPYFRPAFQPQAWRLTAARVLNRLYPWIALNVGLRLEQFAHDREVQMAIRDDSASHQKMSARMALQLLAAGESLCNSNEPLAVPTVLLHGDQDTINSFDASFDFAQRQPQIEFVPVPGGAHQIHQDGSTRSTILAHLLEFLNRIARGES